MKKKSTPIIAFIMILFIAGGLSILSYFSERIPANPDGTIGNTAGNLNNGGLFCEQNGRVYFANPKDKNCLYSMNADETDVKKIYDGNVCNILAGGEYLYYFMREPVGTSLDKLRVSHAFYRSRLDGKKVKTMTNDVVVHAQLVNDSLYLMTTAGNTPSFYRISTNRSDKTELADYLVNPSCARDGMIYYNGTKTNHYLYSHNTANDSCFRG